MPPRSTQSLFSSTLHGSAGGLEASDNEMRDPLSMPAPNPAPLYRENTFDRKLWDMKGLDDMDEEDDSAL